MAGVPVVGGANPRRTGWLAQARGWARFGTEGYPKKVRRRLQVLNVMAALMALFSALFALTYAMQGAREYAVEIVINLVLVGAACTIPFAHRHGELTGAVILVIAEYAGLFAIVALMGRASGIHLNLIAASTVLFAVLGLERIRPIVAILLLGFGLHVSAWLLFPGARPGIDPAFLTQLYLSSALTVFAVTAAICWYAFTLVEKAEDQSESLLRNVLPDVIAERLKEDPSASVADDFPDVSILFSDLEGFTPLSQSLGAARTVKILDDLVRGFDRLAARHGVEKIKTIGDAYMAASGVPEPVPDHAERLVRMALDMRDSAHETALRYEACLTLRIGIAAGPVTAGVIGSRKFSYDVWGDPVNLAARLEEYCPSGGILVSDSVAQALPADIRILAQGRRQIRGVGEVDTHLVLGLGGPGRRDPGGCLMAWRASIVTLFPEMFPGPLGLSLAGEALRRGTWSLETADIRPHGLGRHRRVDDTPSGGGPGMVLRADVLGAAIDGALAPDDPRPRLLMSPRGQPLTQARVRKLAAGPGVLVVCGRFEGVDERVIAGRSLEEVSIGDYVLSGGEIGALVLLDACLRLLPGVMGKEASGEEESFEGGRLEYPHYTRPQVWEEQAIPPVLTGGNHAAIARWRREEALRITRERRPDLLLAAHPGEGRDPVVFPLDPGLRRDERE